MGRFEALKQLERQLYESERIAISTLTGMGGIGKTELALQYALADRDKDLEDRSYKSGICWINVSDKGNVGTQILSFAQNYLKIPILEEGEIEERVKLCWQNWGKEDTLIIFDDVRQYKQIKDFLPPQQKRFKVIITTRKKRLAESIKVFALEVLDEKSALELIISFIGEERINKELKEAKLLCKELGYLPLGLELVARFLKRRQNWSIKKYRDDLKKNHLATEGLKIPSEEMTAQEGVKQAFEITWKELNQESQLLAYYLSLFEVAPIELTLIQGIWSLHKEKISSQKWGLVQGLTNLFNKVIKHQPLKSEQNQESLEIILEDNLINSSLIKDSGNQIYEVHTLIHQYLREKLENSKFSKIAKETYCQLMVSISQQIPEQPIKTDIEGLTLIIPHLSVAANELNEWIEDEELIWPYVGISRFYEAQGFYKEAEPWRKQCLDIVKQRLGEDHPYVASSLNNLANLYNAQGRYSEAEPLYLQALELYKKLLGEDHPNTKTVKQNYEIMKQQRESS